MIARLKRRAKRQNTMRRCGCYRLRDMDSRKGWWCRGYSAVNKRKRGTR